MQADGFKTLTEGEHVCYNVQDGWKGPAASNVHAVPYA